MRTIFKVMTILSATLTATLGFAANAAQPEGILECEVPNKPVQVEIHLIKDLDRSTGKEVAAFMINDRSGAKPDIAIYRAVVEGDELAKEMAKPQFQLFGIGENFSQQGGVLRDIASMVLSYNELGDIYEGLVSAKGNAYPVICHKIKAAKK